MMKIRVVLADDERPAREYLKSMVAEFDEVELVGEADNGPDAVEIIRSLKPDLALLDLRMPEMSGLEVVKMLRRSYMPQIAFVTAHDEYAVQAFEVNAIDYLLKPVERSRLAETIARVAERLKNSDWRSVAADNVQKAVAEYESGPAEPLERLPVKVRDEILLVPVREIVAVIADGELLHISTVAGKKYAINFRLKDLELRLDDQQFVRLSRGAIVNVDQIDRVTTVPGGTYIVSLLNGQEVAASRTQSKVLRERLLKL